MGEHVRPSEDALESVHGDIEFLRPGERNIPEAVPAEEHGTLDARCHRISCSSKTDINVEPEPRGFPACRPALVLTSFELSSARGFTTVRMMERTISALWR